MSKLSTALAVLAFCAVPLTAQAGFVVEGSVGKGLTVDPLDDTATNIMIAPGYGLGEILRLELGFAFNLPDVGDFDLELRPMLVLDPPLFPVYGRLILGVTGLLSDVVIAYGGALGVGGSLFGIGAFAEVGVLPRSVADTMFWVIEGRLGVYYAF